MRIAIIGTSGSGKTTLAKRLSEKLQCKHVEIDAYAWHSGWIKKEDAVIVEDIRQATSCESWVSCGNYRLTRDVVWKRATHLVWLKYPLRIVLWRLFKRTLFNIFTRKVVAGGNVESFLQQFFSKKSIFLWAIKTHFKRRIEYPSIFATGIYDHLKVVILRSQKEVDLWVSSLIDDLL